MARNGPPAGTCKREGIRVTQRKRVLSEVPTRPSGQEWAYQLARVFQLSPTEIGLVVNIRRCQVKAVDLEIGNDLVIADSVNPFIPKVVVPLNRSEIAKHPRTGEPTLMSHFPLAGGFVPLAARRKDGTPHPHAGTGFALSHIMGVSVDASGMADQSKAQTEDLYEGVELQHYRYDGTRFVVEHSEVLPLDALLQGWHFTGMPMGNCIPDGDDLLGTLTGKPSEHTPRSWKRELKPVGAGSGIGRWRRSDVGWRLVDYRSVTGKDGSDEPSLVRDSDGSLLLAARTGSSRGSHGRDINVWRSRDNGATWEQVIHAPGLRTDTPISINRALDGTLYVAANPQQQTDARQGQAYPSIQLRERLLLWPLSEDRCRLLDPILVRDCNADFGEPPHGSIWLADHPVGMNARLADGQWRHVFTYRVLELEENRNGAPTTPFTGTYVEEVLTSGPAIPEWIF